MTENSPEPPMAGRTSSVGIFNTGNPLDGLKFVTGMLEDGVAEEVLQRALIRPTTGPNTPFWRTPPQDIAITDTALTAEILVVVFCDFMELL